ncbi:MAG: hypothetical protein WCJ71_03015 [Candidatus Omnitrophota bacterium]
MNNLLLLVVCLAAWLAWIPAALMQKKAKGESEGISIFPIIPFFPLIAWGIGLGLNNYKANFGFYVIGGLHIVLLTLHLSSIMVSTIKISQKKS